jgi:hypothetical protein
MGSLPAASRVVLAHEFARAFTSLAGLREVLASELGAHLDEIVPASDSLQNAILQVVTWASNQGRLGDLITAAVARNPQNAKLRALATIFPQSVAADPVTPPPGETADPFKTVMLPGGVPFVNREAFREGARALTRPGGPTVLVVNGPHGTGKSYSLQFLTHLSMKLRTFNVASIDIATAPYASIESVEVVRTLAAQIGRDPDALPPLDPELHVGRAINRLIDWFLAEIALSQANWWLVFDGFDNPAIPFETHHLVYAVTKAAAEGRPNNLRVVLLGYPDALVPSALRSQIVREEIAPLRREDVHAFIRELSRSRAIAIGPAQVSSVVDAVMQLGDDPRLLNSSLSRVVPLLR